MHVQMFLRVVRRRVLLPQLRHRTHLIIALLPELATSLSQLSVVSSSVARDVARRKSIVTCCSLCVRAAVLAQHGVQGRKRRGPPVSTRPAGAAEMDPHEAIDPSR